ncbi:Variant UBP zinc finger/Zn-finger in ubiquitin-hydrolases and other protein/Ubiquitin carboxyl-terminal hydrolase/UBA/TS-N domain containing protein, putative [Angomonas deanei]|uniref:Ubiquitin carboxyl-terminal hydrolase n=1 Tax=Angomonas deanei TaxID=59799 RepID=A0A7G2CGI9_9TRYP|nr:Variant UBP zinc finger/Zn-finger in ubiquitin-hydrolases and other protein/Ubiquitin carboxyl-terminal hydrolase/UBA/TS-N domain containing protein, putative [Angomonas deanei]
MSLINFAPSAEACPHSFDESAIVEPKFHSTVNKEECAYCCKTCRHDAGLYVCMCCFTGVCVSHIPKHMSLHPTHVMYTLVKELPEKKVEKTEDVNMLGVTAPKEYQYAVCCASCKLIFTAVPASAKDSHQGIINAAVAGAKDDGMGADYQKPQCPHLICLAQQKSPFPEGQPPTSTLECSTAGCACNVNNWMCLTCGNIGCPRSESGGNGHALQHFAETGHPASVKLGTVTPVGGDFYCYKCDDDVSDVYFAAHMAHFGVDVKTAKKTAKTMGEMMYDYSSKFDFDKITEAGENLEPVYGPGRTGIYNIGNTCYIASVLQCLFNNPAFQQAFYSGGQSKHQAQCRSDPYHCRACQLERIASGLLSGQFSIPNLPSELLNGIGVRYFKTVFAQQHPEFSTGSQQDAGEYFLYLLEEMARHVRPFDGNTAAFHGFDLLVEQRVQCSKCQKVKYHQEKESLLSLPVPVDPLRIPPIDESKPADSQRPRFSLEACLQYFCADNEVECKCASCGQPSVYRQSSRIASFPDTIVLSIRRAYFDPRDLTTKKMDVYVDVPEMIDLSAYKATGLAPGEVEMTEVATPQKKASAPEVPVDEVALVTVVSMGVDMEVAQYALRQTNMNVERAIDYIFSHPDIQAELSKPAGGVEQGKAAPTPKVQTDGSPRYALSGMISHMGSGAKTGHYVSHIKDDSTGKWIIFNDEKTGVSRNPPLSMATMYFFKRV